MKALRQQWLLLRHETPVAIAIANAVFSEFQNPGFELLETKHNTLRGRFIEKLIVSEKLDDPFGNTMDVSSVKYIFFEFSVLSISSGLSLVKVVKPPLSLRNFIGAITAALGCSVSIGKVEFDLNEVFTVLAENPMVTRLHVPKAAASQIPIGKDSVAKIEIASTGNALAELYEAYDGRYIRLDRFVMNARVGFEAEVLEISSSGSITCTPKLEAMLENLLSSRYM